MKVNKNFMNLNMNVVIYVVLFFRGWLFIRVFEGRCRGLILVL